MTKISFVNSSDCFRLFGNPVENESKFMTMFNVPENLRIKTIPKAIYCNKLLIEPLSEALGKIIKLGIQEDIKTWDGCFNIRSKRNARTMSLHSWGVAIDINAAWNRLGARPKISNSLVTCFKSSGFDWGGDWSAPDGMHFQLNRTVISKDD